MAHQSVLTAPENYPFDHRDERVRVFLAGSIEMDKAEKWQDRYIQHLARYSCIVLNPRRDSWDTQLEQSINNPEFTQQVQWELDSLELAEVIIFYIQPGTISPITLMELGKFAVRDTDKDILVYCPDGYFRKGNVDVLCNREGHEVYSDETKFLQRLDKVMKRYEL